VQLVYLAVAIALGVLIPRISVGVSVPASRATEMLVAVGAGFVPFIGIVYSMLFLVVEFGSTTFTPRLNLFRDDPIVWHGFSFFTAVIVFAFIAVFAIGSASDTTLLVPIFLGIAILATIALLRGLQTAAFRSIQLASILEQLSRRGREVIEGVHPEMLAASDRSGGLSNDRASRSSRCLPTAAICVGLGAHRSSRQSTYLAWCAWRSTNGLASICAWSRTRRSSTRAAWLSLWGSESGRWRGPRCAQARVRAHLRSGSSARAALACRYDAARALSPAVNDPTTTVQALDAIADLLRLLVARDLGVEVVDGADRTPRVVLKLPSWEDYVSVGLDEIIETGLNSVQVRRRLGRLLEDLVTVALPPHREPIERRLATMTGRRHTERLLGTSRRVGSGLAG